jgi:hypothetical protein
VEERALRRGEGICLSSNLYRSILSWDYLFPGVQLLDKICESSLDVLFLSSVIRHSV